MQIEDNENGEVAMIMDVTGIVLIPGNFGEDCPGNGETTEMECCCDECDYMICCILDRWMERCKECGNTDCPRYRPGV